MTATRHGGRWTLEDRFGSCWQYLPVEVPPGTYALRAELEYERSGAVVDLGCVGPAGFRGWSGGSRRSFVITADSATPGYLPGELEPGTWQVMIGLHMLPPGGSEYRVVAEVSSTPGQLRPGPGPDPTPPLGEGTARPRWGSTASWWRRAPTPRYSSVPRGPRHRSGDRWPASPATAACTGWWTRPVRRWL